MTFNFDYYSKLLDFFIHSDQEQTSFVFGSGALVKINRPIQEIPSHLVAAMFVKGWRDAEPTVFRRVVTGIAYAALAVVGLADIVAHLILSLIALAVANSPHPYLFLKGAGKGLATSIELLTFKQYENIAG